MRECIIQESLENQKPGAFSSYRNSGRRRVLLLSACFLRLSPCALALASFIRMRSICRCFMRFATIGDIFFRWLAKRRAARPLLPAQKRSRSAHRPMENSEQYASRVGFEQYTSIPFQMLSGCVMSRSGERCVRIAEVEGSIPFESTKNGNRRGKNHGDFSFDHRNTTDRF